jgi:parallel beta-helix repeat protein
MGRIRLLCLACTAAAAVAAVPAGAASNGRNVAPNGTDTGNCARTPCRTINYALSQANPGDRILVAPGRYAESVHVTKVVTLLATGSSDDGGGTLAATVGATATAGSGGAVIDATGLDNGVVIDGPATAGTVMRGFTVRNANLEGVLVERTSDITIVDNLIAQNDALWDPNNVPEPCQSSDDCGEALHLNSVNDSTLRGNVVRNNVGGILLTDELGGPSARNLIVNNTVVDNEKDCGITLASHYFSMTGPAPADQGGIYDNTVTRNESSRNGSAGIGIFDGPPGAAAYRNVVSYNVADSNGLPGVAMHAHAPFQNFEDNVVTANTLSRNGPDDDAETGAPTGITLWSAVVPIHHTVISRNRISHEYYGIYTANAVQVEGLATNRYDDVAVPVSMH